MLVHYNFKRLRWANSSKAKVAALVGAIALSMALPSYAANGDYCDDPDPVVNCLDPALEPGNPNNVDRINHDKTPINPGVPIKLADHSLYDGIYQCSESDRTHAGNISLFVSINGHPSGDVIFIVDALDPNTDQLAGYGKGQFVNGTFTGTTNKGGAIAVKAAMSADANGKAQATLTGTVRIKGRDTLLNSIEYDATISCVSVW